MIEMDLVLFSCGFLVRTPFALREDLSPASMRGLTGEFPPPSQRFEGRRGAHRDPLQERRPQAAPPRWASTQGMRPNPAD
jgi:hypothetical protein